MVGGVVQLNEVIRSLVEKHPEPVSVTEGSILKEPILKIHPKAYADTDSSFILKVVITTKGGVQVHLVWMLMTGEIYLLQTFLGIIKKIP